MVSILLPISNTENPKLIDRCLKALAKQTYKNFEVLIVTSKNSAQKISHITKKYPFIKIFKKDLGKNAARNFAAQKAKGKYLLHLDAEEKVKVISEMNRVSSQFVILDIANKKRFLAKLLIGPNTHPVILKEFLSFCQKRGLRVETIIPLDVSLPIWLNLLPQKLAEKCFPLLYRIDLVLAKIIPPGRYLLKLVETAYLA